MVTISTFSQTGAPSLSTAKKHLMWTRKTPFHFQHFQYIPKQGRPYGSREVWCAGLALCARLLQGWCGTACHSRLFSLKKFSSEKWSVLHQNNGTQCGWWLFYARLQKVFHHILAILNLGGDALPPQGPLPSVFLMTFLYFPTWFTWDDVSVPLFVVLFLRVHCLYIQLLVLYLAES